jgi:hypothetical protein
MPNISPRKSLLTFARRGTLIPSDTLVALTREFSEENKRQRWSAFLRRTGLDPKRRTGRCD